MKQKITTIVLVTLFAGMSLTAQNFGFAKVIDEGTYGQYSTHCVTDINGNTYTAGYFTGDLVIGGTTISSTGGYDIFLLKFNKNGILVWAKKDGGDGDEHLTDIAYDKKNKTIVVCGYFDGTTAFNNGAETSSHGDDDAWVAKYEIDGDFLWAKTCGGFDMDHYNALDVDKNGNVVTTGTFWSDDITFAGETPILDFSNASAVVAKYSSIGVETWMNTTSGDGIASGDAIAVDQNGNIYTGSTTNGDYLINDVTPVSHSSFLEDALHFVKYAPNGKIKWVSYNEISYSAEVIDIAVEGNINIYGAINYEGELTLEGELFSTVLSDESAVITKIRTSDADILWSNELYSSNVARIYDLQLSGTALYASGFFFDYAEYDGLSVTNAFGDNESFLLRTDLNGNGVSLTMFFNPESEDILSSIGIDRSNNIYMTGTFNQVLELGDFTLDVDDEREIFFAKYLADPMRLTPELHSENNKLSLYPNPAIDNISVTVLCEKEINTPLQIINMNGEVVYESHEVLAEGNNSISINVDELTAGMYLLFVNNQTQSFIISK
ncbi:MAG: T9SS type A sorting domain-containing protein [Chitinophagales bacterium]|nr:T9SS type A sorting domain-containing protein [Chitinophagales bacterium]